MTIKTFEISLAHNEPFPAELANLLDNGWEVRHISPIMDFENHKFHERWILHKDETKAATPLLTNVQVRLIQQIEVRETYSKSKQQMFKYLRCTLDDDSDFVNIFDHPDDARNTFKIIKERGWFDLDDPDWLDVGREIDPDLPIAVTISNDGEWNSLVDIMEHDKYDLFCSQLGVFDMTTPGPREDEESDYIPFASGSIDDYEVPDTADDDPDDDDVSQTD